MLLYKAHPRGFHPMLANSVRLEVVERPNMLFRRVSGGFHPYMSIRSTERFLRGRDAVVYSSSKGVSHYLSQFSPLRCC